MNLQAIFIALVTLISANTSCWAIEPACPPEIRVGYADSELPPYILGIGPQFEDPPGLFVVWTRTAIARLGCIGSLREVRLPYNRIVADMGKGALDFRVTGGYRTDVLNVMLFPMRSNQPDASLAVAEAATRLYVPAGATGIRWNGQQLMKGNQRAIVGTVRGHFSEKVLQSRNWEFESTPNWEANVKKLFAGRVDAIAGSDSVVDALPERAKMDTLDPPVQNDLFFAPVGHPFYEKFPAFTKKFWFEICKESRSTFTKLPACRKI